MELHTTIGKIERLLSSFLCSPETMKIFEENADIKEAIGRISFATNIERSNTDPIFIEECFAKASTDLADVLSKKDLNPAVRDTLQIFEVLVNRHLRDICVLSDAETLAKNPLMYEKMEQENRELREMVTELRLHAEDVKTQLHMLQEKDIRTTTEPLPVFVPEANPDTVEQEVTKMIKQLNRAKTIAKEIRDMDEKWMSILGPVNSTLLNVIPKERTERVLKSQSMFNLYSKEP